MAFAFIQAASRPFLETGEAGEPAASAGPSEADRAVAVLRADYERWSRWALGIVGFIAAAGGVFFAGGLVATVVAMGVVTPDTVIAIAISAGVALAGAALLVALWRSGRALTRAASYWLRAPYVNGQRAPRAAGWVQARTVNLEPRILVRLLTVALALLVAVGGVAVFIRDLGAGVSIFTVPALLVGICGALSGIGQSGGVLRIVNGLSAGDPLWSWLTRSVRAR
ncbi:hypothetical protein O1W71_11385 [Microbacterium sp. H37-C3]|uniref:hypothetical protein n=1 Tax=Microbacterium sp. H37-C3 TaxID=3004354 RepID=UPI0022AFE2F4|nr:hypothetical protein [Microbacterium sp. H37-C3]MCZ4068274.1 hypothetical protein [Microbacterium sp. H37-C3]